jgi:hypothetical protein
MIIPSSFDYMMDFFDFVFAFVFVFRFNLGLALDVVFSFELGFAFEAFPGKIFFPAINVENQRVVLFLNIMHNFKWKTHKMTVY